MNSDEELFARMIERSAADDTPRPEHQERLREQVLKIYDRAQTSLQSATIPKQPTFHWRNIMRHPISRVVAAIIFVLALGGVAVWFHGGGAQMAFADFIQPILDAKTAKFKMTAESEGQPPQAFTAMFLAPAHLRQEMPGGMVMISDFSNGKMKMLTLNTKDKVATLVKTENMSNLPKSKVPQNINFFDQLRSQLLDVEKNPKATSESLGEKEIGGHRAIGFRISGPRMAMNVWGDPNTGLPVRIEQTMDLFSKSKIVWSDFEFNVKLDESLFSLEPPAGYTIMNLPTVNASLPGEKDLIESLRQYCEAGGGPFPDELNMNAMTKYGERLEAKLEPEKEEVKKAKDERKMQELVKKLADPLMKILRGLQFVLLLPKDADAHYAGKGIALNAKDTPIFWYRPKDSKTYRVIYADLSVKEAERPPDVPGAQVISATAKPEK